MSAVPELFAREALGVVTSERFGVFTQRQSAHIASMPAVPASAVLPIYTVIDPTGGGMSKLAMATIGITVDRKLSIVSSRP